MRAEYKKEDFEKNWGTQRAERKYWKGSGGGEDFQAEGYGEKKSFDGQLGAAISTWKRSKLGWTNGCSTFSFFSDKGPWAELVMPSVSFPRLICLNELDFRAK